MSTAEPGPLQEGDNRVLYKLTNEEGRSGGVGRNTQWGPGVTHCPRHPMSPGDLRLDNPLLCGSGFLYAYPDLNLALLLNGGMCQFDPPRLWEATGRVVRSHWNEVECSTLMTIRELPLPDWYLCRRRHVVNAFARLCANAAAVAMDPSASMPASISVIIHSHCAAEFALLTVQASDDRYAEHEAVITAVAADAAAAAAGRTVDFVALARQAVAQNV